MDSDDSDPPDTQTDGGVTPASEDAVASRVGDDAVASRVGDDAVAGTVTLGDGRELPVALDGDIVEAARDAGVDPSRVADAAAPDVPDDFNFDVTPRSGRVHAQDGSATIPVQDKREALLASSRVSDFDFIQDPQIRKLQQNSIDYNQRIGRFILAKDDLVPSVKERIKALIVGTDGMSVDPEDPDTDADQRLADHLRGLYENDVRPTDVIDAILRENLMHARAVLRSTDLEELDLSTLDYLKDGISGEEIYMQDPTTVYEFDVEEGTRGEPGDIDVERRMVDAQPLVIGEQVFDISLYDEPPLEAIADTAVNKMVMQRLKARKAELTSFGAVYAKVEAPSYLPEDQYFDRVQDDSGTDEGDAPPTKLERALRSNMQSAFDHLKDWQSGTTMAIPDYWSLEQIDIPDQGTPIDDQIRGYNRSIARRMLVPLDLIELREGAELSRETLFRTLMTTIQGWRAEVIRVFDQFAQVQKDIHDLNGSVEHTFPPIQNQDEELVVQALQYAGIAGLTEKEVRKMLNQVEGISLDTDSGTAPDAPAPGGPDDGDDRSQQMQDFLDQQNDRGRPAPGDDDGGDGSTPQPPTASAQDAPADGGQGPPFDPPGPPDIPPGLEDRVVQVRDGLPGFRTRPPAEEASQAMGCGGAVHQADVAGNTLWFACGDPGDRGPGRPRQQAAQAADDGIRFGNVGGDPFGDQDVLEAFVDALLDAGADQVFLGNEAWPDVSGIHDRPVIVTGLDVDAAQAVWTDFEDQAQGLMGPQAQAAKAFDEGDWVTFRKDGEEHLGRVAYSDDERTLVKRWDPDTGELTDQATTKATSHVHHADPPEGVEAGGSGNAHPATARGPGSTSTPLSEVPIVPDGTDRLSKDALAYWVAWVRSGKPTKDIEGRRFNPELHPRGPDGKFVERPWDIPNSLDIDSIRSTPTMSLLEELNKAGEPIDDVLANDDVRIDGIPDDVNSVSEAKERLGGDGLVFQDLEAGDQVNIVQPNGQKTVGQVQKTEVVDGGPNRAHVATNHGSLHVVDIPEGSTIERQSGPVIPPDEVIGQDPLAPQDIHPNDRVSVVQINGPDQQPTHAATGTVTSVGNTGTSGKKTIQVDGVDYVPDDDGIQVYDATPDELNWDDISEGDTVAAWVGNSKVEGTVDDKVVAPTSDIQYLDIQKDDGSTSLVNFDENAITEPTAVQEGDVDADVGDIDPATLDDDDVSPGDITLDDVGVDDTVDINPSDVEPGDWVVFSPDGDLDDAGVGRVSDISGTGNQALVSTGPGGLDEGGVEEVELYQQDVLERIPQEGEPPDVSTIDPSTVSATALNDDQLSGELSASGFQDLSENDWVQVDTGDGPHVGKVTSEPPQFKYETGHFSDPQQPGAIDNIDSIQTVDPEAVDDIGDPSGTTSPSTSTPDAPDSDFDLDDISGPGTGDVDQDDLNHPATAEGSGTAVGMVDEPQVKAFHELLGDPDQGDVDIFDPPGSDGTSYAPMTYPQANPYKLRDHVGHFANEALDIDDGNEAAQRLLDQAGSWKGTSYTDVGQGLEKRFHAALDLPGDLRNDGLDGDDPSDADAATAALYTAATQEFFRRNWDDIDQQDFWGESSDDGELPLYRGVGKNAVASLARDWADDPEADSITVNESKLANFSTDAQLADSWGEQGHVIKKNATADDVVFSPDVMTGPETGIDGEGEIWLTGGVSETDPRNIQVESGSDTSTMSMDEMMVPPDDMDRDQLEVVQNWARSMDKRDYTLDTENQIQTFEDALDRMDEVGITTVDQKPVKRIVDKSKQAVQQTGPSAQPAD